MFPIGQRQVEPRTRSLHPRTEGLHEIRQEVRAHLVAARPNTRPDRHQQPPVVCAFQNQGLHRMSDDTLQRPPPSGVHSSSLLSLRVRQKDWNAVGGDHSHPQRGIGEQRVGFQSEPARDSRLCDLATVNLMSNCNARGQPGITKVALVSRAKAVRHPSAAEQMRGFPHPLQRSPFPSPDPSRPRAPTCAGLPS